MFKAPAKDLTAAVQDDPGDYRHPSAAGFFGPQTSFSETIDQATRADSNDPQGAS